MAKEFKMSQARYDELKKELDYSKTTRADEVAELIKEARGFGDLSENSEYDEAKNEQGKLYSRIAELEEIFELNRDNAKIRQMKKDVEEYEQTIQRKVQLEEQARLKEREAERLNKNASRLKNK